MLRSLTQANHQQARIFFYLLLVSCSFTLGYFFYVIQAPLPALVSGMLGDAANYADLSDITARLQQGIRTYGYLSFLWIFRKGLNLFNLPLVPISLATLILQFVLYVAAVFFFAYSVTQDKKWQLFIVASLLLNILFIPYFCITLSEALTIPLILICYALYCRSAQKIMIIFLLGLMVAFAVEVRPANMWFFGLISLLFLLQTLKTQASTKNKLRFLFVYGLGILLALLPQIYINFIYFHKITPFPAIGLGEMQFLGGEKTTRVSLMIDSGSLLPLVFPNPFSLVHSHFHWLSIDGFCYGILKLLNMFLYDNLFVYQVLSGTWERLLIFFSCFCVFFGFIGLYRQRDVIPKKHYIALLLGIFFCVILHMTTAFENRYALAIFMALFPLAIYQAQIFLRAYEWRVGVLFVGFFGFMYAMHAIILVLTSAYLRMINNGMTHL